MSDCKTPCKTYKERLDRLESENVYLKKLLLSKIIPEAREETPNKAV